MRGCLFLARCLRFLRCCFAVLATLSIQVAFSEPVVLFVCGVALA